MTTQGMPTDVTEELTLIKRIRRHVGIRLAERDAVQRMGYVEGMRLGGHELVDMSSIPNDALAVCYMKVSSYFVHTHIPINSTSLSLDGIHKGVHIVTYALLRVTKDVRVTPTFRIIRVFQLIAGVATPRYKVSVDESVKNFYTEE